MSTTQTLLWVALPNGVQADGDTRHLRLSVFVTPHLRTDEGKTLAHFPDFLDWAARMQRGQVTFTLHVDDGTQVQATVVSPPPDPTLWKVLFTPDIPVRPYEFDDFSNRPIVSFPVTRVLGYLKERYQAVASLAPFDLPAVTRVEGDEERRDTLDEIFHDLVWLQGRDLRVENEEQLSERLNESLKSARDVARERRAAGLLGGDLIEPSGLTDPDDPRDAFYRAMLFHYRPRQAKPVELPEGADAQARFEEEVDFHQMLSALGDFPQLLRRLGLVFDLQVPADALAQTPTELDFRKVRVVPTWTSTFQPPQAAPGAPWTANYTPWTVYVWSTLNGKDLFFPQSEQGDIAAGLWTHRDTAVLAQVDVDGAALKALNLASSLARATRSGQPRAIDAPEKDGVPTLRTGGVSVVRVGAAKYMNDIFNRSGALNQMLAADPPELADLHAEDLTRGYRLDVFDALAGQWRSLQQRVGTYATLNAPGAVPDIADEGMVQPSVTSPTQAPAVPPDPAQELYIHESLFTWDGWSLSAPRPGKSISRSPRAPTPKDSKDSETQPQRVNNTAMTRLRLETTFKVQDGTLPRLRFGHGYRMRVRAVDLAGNSPTLEEATALEASLPTLKASLPKNDELIYRRFEPINPPELTPRVEYTEGESLERCVIRSNFDQSAEDYAPANPTDRPDQFRYQATNERHVVAPKVSLQAIETHGLLDAALDAKNSGLSVEKIDDKVQEIYKLAKDEAGSLSDGEPPKVRFVRTTADRDSTDDSTDGYAIHTEDQLVLPYLPDPWATGVVFQGLPGLAPGALLSIKFGGAVWHDATPFRLRLVEGDDPPDPPAWDEATRVLTVQLPKAHIARVRVSSLFDADLLEWMGLWQWLREAAERGDVPGDHLDELERGILESRHWMFTPFRELTLVHAVQQPLEEPQPQRLEVERLPGSTVAQLFGAVSLHVPSTSKIDILAEWREARDDTTKGEPESIVDAHAHVMELPTALDGQAIRVDDALRLGDDGVLIFHTGQADYARCELQEELDADDLQANLSTEQRRHLQDQINLASKVAAHEFGDTKYRHVRYRVSATSRFREYFAPSITTDPDNLARYSEEYDLDILSSARPDVPRVVYALPTFGWEQTTDSDGNVTSTRHGGGVRVYLDRPWWSSGEGELLGVVLGQSLPDRLDPLYGYSTFWGQDPVWQSPGLPLPRLPSFKGWFDTATNVRLSELPNTVVTVVGFNVQWDRVRKLWYSDLDLDTADAYYPFIRLALARFQPNSLPDLRLSPVVLADFVQTAPNRAVTVTRDASAPGVYGVAVSGVTYTAQRTPDEAVTAATSQVEVLVQHRDPDIEDEILGWTDLPLTVGLLAGAPDAQGIVIWTGQVTIPPEHQGERLRLVVQEFEMLTSAWAAGIAASRVRRMVYVDTIPL